MKTSVPFAAKHCAHPVQVSQWKKEAAGRLPEVFAGKPDADAAAAKAREKELFEEIGRLKMELEWLKKNWRARALSNVAA